jgi:hypothetical protein
MTVPDRGSEAKPRCGHRSKRFGALLWHDYYLWYVLVYTCGTSQLCTELYC